jgi:homoserine dehydrogenase
LRIALYGTGQVGSALLDRLERLGADGIVLVHVANSRHFWSEPHAGPPHLVLDATASDAIAAHHADWLARGVHVVTANKLARGASLARWEAIEQACDESGAHYGDSATVGAGLPLLRTLRALRRGGDAIHGFAGVLSGSVAWLLSRYDGTRPFSHLVREARDAGYTEPDPRIDLSGEDVRRKLLILARAAGVALGHADVAVDALSTPELAAEANDIDAAFATLDAPMQARLVQARRDNARLHLVARWSVEGGARIALEALPHDDPLSAGHGTDNRVAIHSARYAGQPLVIQGPGAGADITAAAMLDDVFAIRDALRGSQIPAPTRSGIASAKNASIAWGRAIA